MAFREDLARSGHRRIRDPRSDKTKVAKDVPDGKLAKTYADLENSSQKPAVQVVVWHGKVPGWATGKFMRKIIIDCDPGIDDALAIFLALASREELEVLGITCVKGNVALEKTYTNAQRILAAAERLDIPIHRGLPRPILAPKAVEASVHGTDGLGDLGLPDPGLPPRALNAIDFIRDQASRFPGDVMLCAIGPLTNVAVALLFEPDLARTLHSIVFMGGAAFVPGNMNDHSEFNFMADPHAAEIVLQSRGNLVMFGLDVTLQAGLEDVHLERLRQNGNRCSTLAAQLLEVYAVGDRHLHDPCALAWALDTTMFGGVQARVRVVTEAGAEFGRSVAEADPQGNCHVITTVDKDRLLSLLVSRLALLP